MYKVVNNPKVNIKKSVLHCGKASVYVHGISVPTGHYADLTQWEISDFSLYLCKVLPVISGRNYPENM